MPRIAEITITHDGRPCVVFEPTGDEGAVSFYTPEEIGQMLEGERKACARVALLHECYVRDYSRDVFARAISDKIKAGDAPTEQEVAFSRTVQWE